ALLAKTVTTLDVLSGGRAWLGIGAGHYEEECMGLGVPFPPLPVRYELLDDAPEVCIRMWAGDHGDAAPVPGRDAAAGRPANGPLDADDPRSTIERLARHVVPAVTDLGRDRPMERSGT